MPPDDSIMADARESIRALLATYTSCGDRGRIDEMVSVFADHALLDLPTERHVGREAITRFLQSRVDGEDAARLRGGRHHLTTSRIEFNSDDEAQGWTYFFVMRRGSVLEEGVYIDRFARVDGTWCIAARRVKVIWSLAEAEQSA